VALLDSQEPILLTDHLLRLIFIRQAGSILVVCSDISHNPGPREHELISLVKPNFS